MKKCTMLLSGLLALGLAGFLLADKLHISFSGKDAIPSHGGEHFTLAALPPVTEQKDVMIGQYPYYLQHDPAWGDMPVADSGETMSQVGCTMSSIAMGLSGMGYQITPGEVCQTLMDKQGLTSNGYVIWAKVAELTARAVGMTPVSVSHTRIDKELQAGRPVIVKILLGGLVQHWVLLIGKQGEEYIALDSLNRKKEPVLLSSLSRKIEAVRVFTRL